MVAHMGLVACNGPVAREGFDGLCLGYARHRLEFVWLRREGRGRGGKREGTSEGTRGNRTTGAPGEGRLTNEGKDGVRLGW